MRAKIPTERQIQVALFQHVEYLTNCVDPAWGLLCSYPLQRGNDVLWLKLRMQEGAKKGWPDLFLPVAKGGYHGLFIELKRKGNKPSESQIELLNKLKKQGYCAECLIVDDSLQVVEFIRNYLDGKILK